MISLLKKKAVQFRGIVRRIRRDRRFKKAAKATRRVFIDCGANTCDVLRDNILKYQNFEFFAFEAQPNLLSYGQKVIAEFPNRKIIHYNKAVWIREEKMKFFLATQWGENYKGGSTLIEGHTENSAKVDYNHPLEVEAIDFSAWLAANFRNSDYVIVKMDIEGAEYDVIEKIIADQNESLIDELIVEFHQQMNPGISIKRHESLVRAIKRFAHLEIWH